MRLIRALAGKISLVSLLTILATGPSAYGFFKTGPSAIGFTSNSVDLEHGTTNVIIWYPAHNELTGPSDDYVTNLFTGATDVAVEAGQNVFRDVSVKQGKYPLIIRDHGGFIRPDANLDNVINNEYFARKGYIVVSYVRVSDDPLEAAIDLSALIDYMLEESPVRSSIDNDAIGTYGFSSSGENNLLLVGGNIDGDLKADSRVKALALDERNFQGNPINFPAITIPVLLIDGSSFPDGGDQSQTFDELVNANPKVKVTLNNPGHLVYGSGYCPTVEGARHRSLQDQFDSGVLLADLAEPLTNPLDAAGAYAQLIWIGFGIPDFGPAGQSCTHLGVEDPLKSTDVYPLDGLVDTPPFEPTGLLTSDEQNRLTKRFQLAFWDLTLKRKTFSGLYFHPFFSKISRNISAIESSGFWFSSH